LAIEKHALPPHFQGGPIMRWCGSTLRTWMIRSATRHRGRCPTRGKGFHAWTMASLSRSSGPGSILIVTQR